MEIFAKFQSFISPLWRSFGRNNVRAGAGENAKEIAIHEFYRIFQSNEKIEVPQIPNLPENADRIYAPERVYANRILQSAAFLGLKEYITVKEISDAEMMYIGKNPIKYKIIIKNLIIKDENMENVKLEFDKFTKKSAAIFDNTAGICFLFKDNTFISSSHNPTRRPLFWALGARRHLTFENNLFESTSVHISQSNKAHITFTGNVLNNASMGIDISGDYISVSLTGNKFNAPLAISKKMGNRGPEMADIVKLNDNNFSELEIFNCSVHLDGKNEINNLDIQKVNYLHWGPRQRISFSVENADKHKEMFMELINHSVEKNDKISEMRLRRELMKCERTLLNKEKKWHSLQDKFIMGWICWISDYGVSWFLPFLWLVFANFAATTIVYFLPSQCPEFWVLFVKFFNPLFDLTSMNGIQDNFWISFIAVVQKAPLAAFYYEIIKIFRRFGK